MITQLPFLIEVIADAWLIKRGKKDLSWKARTLMIAVVCLVCWFIAGHEFSVSGLSVIGETVCFALAPYSFFDIALNLVRFGWKAWKKGKWGYVSSTNGKFFDKLFNRFNPWGLLTLRALFFVGCLIGGIVL